MSEMEDPRPDEGAEANDVVGAEGLDQGGIAVDDGPPPPPPPPIVKLTPSRPFIWGLGRRKSARARVRIKPGPGAFMVNGKEIDNFFTTLQNQMRARAPLSSTNTLGTYDVFCRVEGGGPTGQADAVRMGLARALKTANPAFEHTLREHGLLTRDSRMKERKKYGRRGARRGFQFSKR